MNAAPETSPAPWLQRAVAFGAGLRVARLHRRLAAPAAALRAQEEIRRALLARLATTAFGRAHGLERGLSAGGLAARVAPRTYEGFAPWIARMQRGEPGVLWPGRCAHYAVSSGTTAGRTKFLPVTAAMLAHFRRAGLDSLCLYARRTGGTAVFRGRHLFLGGSTALAPLPDTAGFRAWSGDLSGIAALHLPRWAESRLYEPGREIALIADWPEKLRAIVARTARRDITLLAGIPSWLLIFAEAMHAHTGHAALAGVWPHLECLVHGGVPIAPFASRLRAVTGPRVNFHEVYPASEAFIAAQDDEPAAGLRLLADAGIYYEFLPFDRYDPARLGDLGRDAVPLAGVRPGVDYVLLLTTPAGLCRYVIGDVVRFLSTEPPRLVYVGRTSLQLSAFGEHVIEKELTDAIAAVAALHAVEVGNFHVAPRFADPGAGELRGRHEWWIELQPCTAAPPDPHALAADLDRELQQRNEDYEAKRRGAGLAAPVVRLVAAGTFERWLRARGKWGGQNKMPRCRSDRAVADELAGLSAPV